MDFSQAMQQLNWLAVIAAALSGFIIGGLWYSKVLFGKPWQQATGITDEQMKTGNPAKIFGLSFVCLFIASLFLAMFIGPQSDMTYGGMAGFMAALGWVATFIGMNSLFERKSGKLFLIDAGYAIVTLTEMGLILGAWK
jgi:hypothetical protein